MPTQYRKDTLPPTLAIVKAMERRAAETTTKERQFIEKKLSIPISNLADYSAYLSVGSGRVWATFRSCHLVASIIQGSEMQIVSGADEGEVTDKTLLDLLEQPNPFDTWNELIYQWVYHMKLTGNAYWLRDQPDMQKRPKYLYPLLPQFMKVIPDTRDKVKGYIYEVGGQKIAFRPEEIIHIPRPHPSDMIRGMGDIEPSVDLYQDFINRNKLEEEFLKNGAMPSGILFRKADKDGDMVEATEWGRLKRTWQAEYGGKTNAGKTAFLQGDWSYMKLGLTAAEMQSVEREKMTVEQIFMNHGVPLSIAGVQKAANYATAKQDEINFRKYEIVPLLDILVGKLNGQMPGVDGTDRMQGTFVRAFNESWRMTYKLSGLVNVEEELKSFGPLFDRGGMTLNELREIAGLDKVDNPLFEEYFMTAGRVPLEMAGLASPTDEELAGVQNSPPPPSTPTDDQPDTEEDEQTDDEQPT